MTPTARIETFSQQPPLALDSRIKAVDWSQVATALDQTGYCVLPTTLDATQCHSISELYESNATFRSRIVMERHNFGRGEYKYFAYPLPTLVQQLREQLYAPLAGIANAWQRRLKIPGEFPPDHATFAQSCHAAGQSRPTPLLLRYGTGDYNCLHQDVYGEHLFPLQVALLLSRPCHDFTGGEFVLTEQRPRMQSRVSVVPLKQGDAVIFAVRERPVVGSRGNYRVNMRHGVSPIRSGLRHTLGIIFHDAQ